MPRDARALPSFLGDDATFQAWFQGIHAQLLAVGMVQATDTGQVADTAPRPTTINTYAGYRIYRFNDPQQANLPIFLRVSYGVGSSLDRPRIAFTPGTATNGAGIISGQIGTARILDQNNSGSAGVTKQSYVSGGPGFLCIATSHDPSASLGMNYWLLRSRDASGYNARGFYHASAIGNGTPTHQIVMAAGTVLGNFLGGMAAGGTEYFPDFGTDTAMIPFVWGIGQAVAARDLLVYKVAALAELVPVTVTHLGEARTFLPMGDMGPLSGVSAMSLAFPWEA